MTLPSLERRTPEPVSVKLVWPPVVTSRPSARISTTDGVSFRKTSRTVWASPAPGATNSTIPKTVAMSTVSATHRGARRCSTMVVLPPPTAGFPQPAMPSPYVATGPIAVPHRWVAPRDVQIELLLRGKTASVVGSTSPRALACSEQGDQARYMEEKGAPAVVLH